VAGQWIAIDFDHTIRDTGGTDEPLPGAREAISALREAGHRVIIHSCNDPDHIEQWMNNWDIRFDAIWKGTGKPVTAVLIDDRGVAFRGDWAATLQETLEFVSDRPVRR
jgi:predicted HAD superfamily phosphohydrolase YqeG